MRIQFTYSFDVICASPSLGGKQGGRLFMIETEVTNFSCKINSICIINEVLNRIVFFSIHTLTVCPRTCI